MTTWKNDFIIKNKFSRPGLLLKGVKKIVLHWTATPGASDEREKQFFDGADGGGSRYASAHIFVDSDSATCMIPLNEVAYHANDVYKRNSDGSAYRGVKEITSNANYYSIGIEMCVEKDGTISPETINRTVQVAAELCKMFKLKETDIVRHFDVTYKPCPKPFVDKPELFVDFKNKVRAILDPVVVAPKPVVKAPVYPGHIIQKGDRGNDVKLIQKALGVSIDGTWGNITNKAFGDFQRKNKLVVDYKCGPKSWALLFK